jgi:hypothetical protein
MREFKIIRGKDLRKESQEFMDELMGEFIGHKLSLGIMGQTNQGMGEGLGRG